MSAVKVLLLVALVSYSFYSGHCLLEVSMLALQIFVPLCSPLCVINQDPGVGCLFVNTSTNHLRDSFQRERYFHGVNVVVKGPPWMPHTEGQFDPFWSFVEEDMQLLRENGLNGIR